MSTDSAGQASKCLPDWNWGCSSLNYCQGHPFSVGDDVVSAAGPLQTCAGHAAGLEAAIHAMQGMFHTANCEAALLVDASMPSIPSTVTLHSIISLAILCPALSIVLHNTYSAAV